MRDNDKIEDILIDLENIQLEDIEIDLNFDIDLDSFNIDNVDLKVFML